MGIHIEPGHYDRRADPAARPRMGSRRATVMVPAKLDGRTVNARAHVRRYAAASTSFSTVPWGGVDPLLEGFRDAADECEHGSLPSDRTIACGCWGLRSVAARCVDFLAVAA